MKNLLLFLSIFVVSAASSATNICPPALDFYKRPLTADKPVHLCEAFKDKVVLVVNTASKCAFTSQYEGLEALHDKLKGRGFMVAGFPSNDFANQEPGTEKQIQQFCRLTFGVQFPMFEKTRVKGGDADPFYKYLGAVSKRTPRWNFHKYLINRKGEVVASFPSHVEPDSTSLLKAIEDQL
jgi:glutathione peroxidase